MMTITLEKTVSEIARETPSSIPVFETLGIDYCCGGRKPLEQACSDLHLSGPQVLKQLEEAAAQTNGSDSTQWQTASLEELIHQIVGKHHKYVRQEFVRLERLGAKVRDKHGADHPELKRIVEQFLALRDELSMHMMKEEQVLFPYIARLERGAQLHQHAPEPGFGTAANPIRMMMAEHDDAGLLIGSLRELSNQYTPPESACTSYHAFYAGLKEFERDLHQHIHLENNILFPRTLALEQALKAA